MAQMPVKDRMATLTQNLNDLSINVPGLRQKASISVSGSTLQEVLRGIANTHRLNLNIDPSLTEKVTNYFDGETVSNVLIYLAKQYNLDFNFTGNIIYITHYQDPYKNLPPPPKELRINYNNATGNITLDLHNDSLMNVAKRITVTTNKNVVVVPDLFGKTVSGYIQDLPIPNALEKLALTNNFKFTRTNDEVYVLEPLANGEKILLKPELKPIPNSNTVIRKFNGNSSGNIDALYDNSGRKMISLNVNAMPIRDVLRNIADQTGMNYFIYTDIQGNITANFSNIELEKALQYIFQGTEYTYRIEKDIYMIGNRLNEGLRTYKIVQLQNRSMDSLMHLLPPELKKNVEVKEFKELNSLLLSGSAPDIEMIQAFVKQIDKVVPMITIEVILMDVKKGKSIKTGIRAGVSDSVKTGGTFLGERGLDYTFGAKSINDFLGRIGINNIFNLGKVTPNFYVQLSALESNSNIDLRQTPKLSTLNGHVANLSIGSTRYYTVSTQNVMGSLNPQTLVTQQYIPVEANLSIDIMPIVSGDEQVTLNIDVKIADFIGDPPNNAPPPSSNSKFKSIIRVKNEEMVVLGGIERNEKSESGGGIPVLSRIPVLKWLFSSRSRTTSKTVSLVFIKPTIIY
ncbi:secretin and TonB N-terminal domain-containing protein [Chitinophaga flava]|uniref:General secretion pathway protein GspD n=1 Tax=Chitinophaga flava TaxID=2259036 RepID=A0A365Y0D8_9BACT|nr:secretin and TonB N-terminal domain-containing protein [Chitinophaga flava]RBL91721.1 general secretion pathway protein GspD [Chitinophaga flava]